MKQLIILSFIFISIASNAQSILGEWVTYDDETNEKTSVIKIYKQEDKYFGEILKIFDGAPDAVCDKCPGEKKDKPIVGLVIIENLIEDDGEYNDGTIMDPESGEVYSCYLELIEDNKLKVRGYIGFSLIGRTQYWIRKS